MASADIKPDVKATRHKRTGSCPGYCNILSEVLLKLEIQCKVGVYFSFNFAFFLVLSVKNMGWCQWQGYLTDKPR